MSTAFGVHIGNSSACIAVSKEGKTDVVANDAGDRWVNIDETNQATTYIEIKYRNKMIQLCSLYKAVM